MWKQFRPALVSLLALSVVTGIVYPAVVTGIAMLAFPDKARGSVIERDGRPVGSALIGQPFSDPKYFWGRPSATALPYDAAAGAGSNLAPTNPALAAAVNERIAVLKAAHPSSSTHPVPVELVTASGSGLDPHISPTAARYQVARVAAARGMPVEDVQRLVDRYTRDRTFNILGESRVNVLRLNLALDAPAPTTSATADIGPVLYRWRGVLPEEE